MPCTWWPERCSIADDSGRARCEVRNHPGFATRLMLGVAGGEEIAEIRRRRGGRFQVIVGGQQAGLVRLRGADRYDIHGAIGALAISGSVRTGRYAILSGATVMATVSRQLADDAPETQGISVDISDENDTAVMLATVLATEAVRYERGEARVNPSALLDLVNPVNWLRVWWDSW